MAAGGAHNVAMAPFNSALSTSVPPSTILRLCTHMPILVEVATAEVGTSETCTILLRFLTASLAKRPLGLHMCQLPNEQPWNQDGLSSFAWHLQAHICLQRRPLAFV